MMNVGAKHWVSVLKPAQTSLAQCFALFDQDELAQCFALFDQDELAQCFALLLPS